MEMNKANLIIFPVPIMHLLISTCTRQSFCFCLLTRLMIKFSSAYFKIYVNLIFFNVLLIS